MTTSMMLVYNTVERHPHPESRWRSACDALAAGRFVLLCDDIDTPTRGDLVAAADRVEVTGVAFAIRHGSGFVQVALSEQRCATLGLGAQCGSDDYRADQCVTGDAAAGIGTGISAADRCTTIRLLAACSATGDSFSRPGHVVPARVDDQCPRDPFAAAALELSRGIGGDAALFSTVVGVNDVCELASGTEILDFASAHGISRVGLNDIHANRTVAMTMRQPDIASIGLQRAATSWYTG